jgi:type II secretory pathway component GspD/PulD (secretin)
VGSNGIQGLTFRIFGDYKVTLDALARQNKVKVLSRPHILTADNQEARILVGQEVPIITSQSDTDVTGTGGQSRFLQNVQYRDTGVVVNVTPQVNSEGLVNMLISQEVSEVAGADQSVQGIVSPTFTTREAETTVVVQSGETVVIGGIISETKNDSRGGVPYLMDVPVLGQLFRSHSDSKRKIELIILITPYVVRDRDEARSVTAQFKARVDDVLRELNIEEVDNAAVTRSFCKSRSCDARAGRERLHATACHGLGFRSARAKFLGVGLPADGVCGFNCPLQRRGISLDGHDHHRGVHQLRRV